MRIKARAKINLSLDIVDKRDDGYHELDTIFCEIGLCDYITIEKTASKNIALKCSDDTLSCGEDNLAHKAAKLLMDEFSLEGGLSIYIEKNIPMGAGLGGGSSDAAAVLKAINSIYSLGLSDEELKKRAVTLGADVPFFISGGISRAKGIGDVIEPLDNLKLPSMIVVKPEVSVPTAFAYKAYDLYDNKFHPDIEGLIRALYANDINKIFEFVGNSFEGPVFEKYTQIQMVKESLLGLGADACVMTGSGSALFALFENNKKALAAYELMQKENKDIKSFLELGGENEKADWFKRQNLQI